MFSWRYKLSSNTNTYAWIIATATSRRVRRSNRTAVRAATVGIKGRSTKAAVAMS